MTNGKNPSNQNYEPKQTENNEKNRSQEVELPIPEKKNDVITTNTNSASENIQVKAGKLSNDDTDQEQGNEKLFRTGFDVTKTKKEKKDKRGNETERLEREKTTDPKTKDAGWQQNKINEANNQQGNKQNYQKGYDTRKDSIIDRPRTETYESGKDENAGDKIKRENYTHTAEEEKRDEINRKKREKAV
jgi:hypothetical protein